MKLSGRHHTLMRRADIPRDIRARAARYAVWGMCWAIIGAVPVWGQPTRQDAPVKTEFGFDTEDDTPLVDREPFDRITANYDGKEYKFVVKPLGLEGPVDYEQGGTLRFELQDRQGQLLQMPWSLVTKLERFEELIVAETRSAFQNGDLDTAFRNLIYLFDRHGANDPLVRELLEQFWYRDALQLMQAGNYELAATVLEELYFKNPGFRGDGRAPIDVLAEVYDQRLQRLADEGDVVKVAAELEFLKNRYVTTPPPIGAVRSKWMAELDRRGQEFLDRVVEISRGNDPLAAHTMARRAIFRLPEDARAWSTYRDVVERFPLAIVGVVDFADQPDIRAADHWSARRAGGLLQRQLVDLIGLGEDGGRYEFADGRIEPTDEFGLSYRFEILTREENRGPQAMTAMELANRLRDLVREGSDEFYFPLAKIIDSIAIADYSNVEIRLRQPFARIESLLRVPYQPANAERGMFVLEKASENAHVYRPTDPNHPWTIVEQRFASSTQAADALLAGEIDVLDRVYPADLERLRQNPQILVRPYVVPSIHVLIPNPRTSFMRDPTYRRSLLYAIDRQRIVEQLICGGKLIPGFRAISGPLPTGSDENDLIGYGYNDRVEMVPFNPGMGIALPEASISRLRKVAADELRVTRRVELDGLEQSEAHVLINKWLDENPSLREPKLVLAHPATELATTACQTIQQMWSSVGRTVELKALPPGVARPQDDDYDLFYAEITMEEPLVDLRFVLGELGLAKQISPTLQQLLSELDLARNWVQARQLLRQIHDQCNAEATVLPLWQLINYYAYRRNVSGLGESQVRLYDNIDRWNLEPRTDE